MIETSNNIFKFFQCQFFFAGCIKSIAGNSEFIGKLSPKNLFEHSEKSLWYTPNHKGGYVIFNLGCAKDFNTVELAATICSGWRDRGAKHIIVSIGDSPDGEWTEVLSETLKDYRKDKAPLPLVTFPLEEMVNSQFVKMECTEFYGWSCALQYFNVVKKTGKHNNSDQMMILSFYVVETPMTTPDYAIPTTAATSML